MRINKVTLTNFCQHAQREDAFGPGIIGILGPNGSGKSNYVKSILRGITGASGNAGRKEEDVMWGQDKGMVEVEFTVNEHVGVIRRQLSSASCFLKYGEKSVRTVREVDQMMETLIGVDKHVLADMVFVQQGAIEGILFQRPSDRAKALQNLFGTASAETLRTMLLDEINNTHVESRAEPIARLEKALVDARARLDEINAQVGALKCDDADINKLLVTISEYKARAQAKENLKELEEHLGANQESLSNIGKQIQVKQTELSSLMNTLDAARLDHEISQKRIQQQQSVKLQLDEQARLLKEKETIVMQLAQVLPEFTGDLERLEKLTTYCEELRASVAISKKVLSNKEGECPTCRQPITATHMGRHRLSLAAEEPQLDMYEKELREQIRLRDNYNQLRYAWLSAQNSAKNNLVRVESRLNVLGELKTADLDITRDLEFVGSFKNIESLAHSVMVELSGLQAGFRTSEQHCSQIMEQVNALRVQAGEAPFLDVLKMEEDLRRLEKERETFSCLCGERVELLRRLTIDSQTLEIYKGEEAIASARCNWRALVERVRMVLHRDQLPNIVAQAYLGALNTKLSDYLSIFESTFMAQIKPDISIECQFPGGHIATAERLSGGQKVMLGIAFRFAIYDLFAQSLGFMVLDEPTVYLDSDHVESVFTLLERVKSYSAAAGLQLIVVTHEMRLAGVLDKVINLGLPVAC